MVGKEPMNKTIKDNWIKALRSKEYVQGRTSLRQKDNSDYHYCCLGVLADITPGFRWNGTDLCELYIDNGNGYCGIGFLNYLGRDHVGMTHEQEGILASMNDGYGKTFEDIADWIDKNL